MQLDVRKENSGVKSIFMQRGYTLGEEYVDNNGFGVSGAIWFVFINLSHIAKLIDLTLQQHLHIVYYFYSGNTSHTFIR